MLCDGRSLVHEAPPTTPGRRNTGQADGTSSDSSSDLLSAVAGSSSPSSGSGSASDGRITAVEKQEKVQEESRAWRGSTGPHTGPTPVISHPDALFGVRVTRVARVARVTSVPRVGSDLARSRPSASAAGPDELFRDDQGLLPTAWDPGLGVSGRAPPSGQTTTQRKITHKEFSLL